MTRFDPSGPLRGSLRPPVGQVDLPPRGADRGDGGGGDADRGLPRRRRHPLDAGRGRGCRGAVVELASVIAGIGADRQRSTASACAARGRRDRRRQRRHPAAAAAGLARRAGRRDAGRSTATTRSADARSTASPRRCVEMGADLSCREDRLPPLEIAGAPLHGITYELPVASAQVKSCLLFAGLLAEGETTVVEPLPTRDHTRADAGRGRCRDRARGEATPSTVRPADRLEPGAIVVPADISSAAFFVVAALLVAGSEVVLEERRDQPDPHRPAERSSSGWAPGSRSSHGASEGGEPIGDLRVALGRRCAPPRSAAPRSRWRSTSCRWSPSPPASPRGRRRSATPPSCAARSPTGSPP